MKNSLLLAVVCFAFSTMGVFAQADLTDIEKRKQGIGAPEQQPGFAKRMSLMKSAAEGSRIKWRTGSGGNLDSYIYYGDASDPITFNILIDQDVKTLENVKLTLSVWDVDEAQGEVDAVYVNGQFVGTLHGANDSWSINNYSIDPSILVGGTKTVPGVNQIQVDLTVSGWAVTVDWGAISADGGEFNIVEFVPGENKFVSHINPDIHLKFSDDIDAATVKSTTVKLQYRALGGALTDVACTYTVSKDILSVKPSGNLMDGVKYSLLVVGEKDGVKSKAAAQLPNSPSYDFATIPDLAPEGPGATEPGIFPIQVVRNQKQIRNKATVMRVYTNKWTPWADVELSSQIDKLPVKVTIRDEAKNEIASEIMDAERSDIRYAADRVKAGTNSMNMYFDYPASLTDGNHTIEVILEPVDQAAVPPVTFKKTTPITYRGGKTLKVVYRYILAEEWAAGVPAADKTRMDNLMGNCKTFFRDSFPVEDVVVLQAADINLAVPLASYTWPKASAFPALDATKAKPFRDTVKSILLNLDAWKDKVSGTAFVALIPPNFGKRSEDSGWVNERSYTGVSYTVGAGPKPEDNKLIMLRDDGGNPGSGANATTVVHEFGHNYSISTKNHQGTSHTVDAIATEGFWVSKRLNKSTTEGNSEAVALKSLMSVTIQPENERWICDYDYNELFDNVPAASMRKSAATGPHLFVSGGYDMKNQFYLSPVWENEYTTTTYPSQGDLTLVLLNSTGGQLASYNFASYTLMFDDGKTDTVKSFGFFVPTPAGLSTVQIRKGATVLKEIKKSANAPQVTIISPAAAAVWKGSQTISWSGTDLDAGTKLLYTVRYSSDGGQTWLSLAANTDRTTLAVNTSQLPSGKSCVVRVTATDGTLNNAFKDVSFVVDNGVAVGLLSPANNSTNVTAGTSVEATFTTPVAASQITSAVFSLKEYASGVQVTGGIKYSYVSRTLRFVPGANLKYNTRYEARIKTGVTDENGGRLAADAVWTFTTGVDNSGLAVVSSDPPTSGTNITVNGGVTVVFNKDMSSSTLNANSFMLMDNLAKTSVAGTVSYNSASRSAFFAPAAPLKKMNDYKVTLMTTIKSSDNKTLPKNYEFYFVTGSDSTSGVQLAGKYAETGIDDNNDKLFEWLAIDVDVSVVEAGTYSINGKLADKNNSEIVWASTNNQYLNKGLSTIRLKFDGKIINAYKINGPYYLNDLQVYNVSNTDKSDWASLAYTTAARQYTEFQTSTIPVVTGYTPLDGAKDVPVNASVTASFTRQMTASSIDSLNFYVMDRSNQRVSGAIRYDSSSRTATFTPVPQFRRDSVYRVAITTNVRDAAGTRLLKQYNWSFTIGAAASTSSGSISDIYTYPNPFPHASEPREGMYFTYMLEQSGGAVKIRIYSITGDFIREIGENAAPARQGFNQVWWNGTNEAGKQLANGTYIYIVHYTDGAGTEHREKSKFTVLRLR